MHPDEVFNGHDVVEQYRSGSFDPERVQRILTAAANSPGFASQYPIRLLLVEDAATKAAIRRSCEQQRERWYRDTATWMHEALERAGESRDLISITDAPGIVCVFGEIEKPYWRETAWGTVERLRIAARTEGLRAELVQVDSLGFLNLLLDVPQLFSGVAVVTLGEVEKSRPPVQAAPALSDLVLPYQPNESRLDNWNDPVKLGALASSADSQQRAFISDKLLLFNTIQTASDIQACTDIDSMFGLVTREIRRLFRYDRASVAFVDPSDGKLRLRNIHKEHGSPIGENHEVPLEEDNVIGWVVLNKSGILRNDIASEDMFQEQMSAEQLRSDMIAPLISGDNVLGTLNCGSYQANAFTQTDFELLREFGKLVGTAVERMQSNHRRTTCDVPTRVLTPGQLRVRLAVEALRCRDRQVRCAVLLVHVDRIHGLDGEQEHELSDRVLTSIGQAVRETVRDLDTVGILSDKDIVTILPEIGAPALQAVGERIRGAVQGRLHASNSSNVVVRTTVSLGGATSSPELLDDGDLLAYATAALERTRDTGSSPVVIYDLDSDCVETLSSAAGD